MSRRAIFNAKCTLIDAIKFDFFGSHKYVVVPEPERMSRDQAFSTFPASSIAMQTAGINQEHGIGDVTFSEEQAEQEEKQEEQEEESEDPPVSEGQSEDTPEL